MSSDTTGGAAVLVDPLGGLQLDPPNELRFKGPFDDYVTVSLTIKNPTGSRIAFKIKTTAPKRYCVKPNSGVLDPGQHMKVNVLLQPFNYDPNEKNKHKFMVQYLYLKDEEIQLSVNDILNMWKDVSPSRLLDLKLKCLFEFTEAEQQKLSQKQPQTNENNSKIDDSSNLGSVTAINTFTNNDSELAAPPVKVAPKPAPQPQTTNQVNKQQPQPANRPSDTFSNHDPHSDFNSTPVVRPTPNAGIAGAIRNDKNDNLENELKQTKDENNSLRKEIDRLREEEKRLRMLVVSRDHSHHGTPAFADLLNNRLVLIVVVLIAIIVYLLLFR